MNTKVILLIASAIAVTASPVRAANLCLTPGSLGVNATVDCDPVNPTQYDNGWRGFATDAAELCESSGCPTDPPPIDCYCLDRAYAWMISVSDTFDDVNVGPPTDTLYLWLCTVLDGMQVAAFQLEGTIDVVAFEPLNGFQNLGTQTDLQLFPPDGCAGGGLVGRITVAMPTSSAMQTWGRTKSSYRQGEIQSD